VEPISGGMSWRKWYLNWCKRQRHSSGTCCKRGTPDYLWKVPINRLSINDPIHYHLYYLYLFKILNIRVIKMKVEYTYDQNLLELKESINGNEVEFQIRLFDSELKNKLKKVRQYFDENKVLTDIYFYIHPNNSYQVIVRRDYYDEFIIQLFTQQLLKELKWT
jgi:hypothetical protein